MDDRPLLPVAQYLRMSTTHQKYSLDHQRVALSRYARENNMEIVKTYSDPGCSGLELKHRPGLRQLLQDVVSKPIFRAIVVYDVSRWGRFQDPDESAHYEFLCKSAGVPVHYCYELFVNDGTVANALLKQLKRTMAGEYSRELGVKVFAAQQRLVGLGHRMGGVAGFGLRRCVVLPDGTQKPLQIGQHKVLSEAWITLIPGPASEVKIVREMFLLAADNGLQPATIARRLNKRGLHNSNGKPWTHHGVSDILTNPKYKGANAWGRTTQRLHSRVQPTPVSDWISREDAFKPVIDRALYDRVQRRLARRTEHQSNPDLLEDLKRLWRNKGYLSQKLIALSQITPSPCTYVRRFGSLLNAYQMIGYKLKRNCGSMITQRDYRNRLRDELIASFQTALPNRIKTVRLLGHRKPMLVLDSNIPCAVTVWPSLITTHGHRRWLARVRKSERKYPMLVCVLDRENTRIDRMFLASPQGRVCWYTKTEHDPWFRNQMPIHDIGEFCSELPKIAGKYTLPSGVFVPKAVCRPS
jgi:DNA invertase Pin-like site-specific DNA recombinase